jgi:decaprenylphospho-beta-D-ribofuranose 2-oxidase
MTNVRRMPPRPTQERLTGWGRTMPARCSVYRPETAAGVAAIGTRSAIARGQGRSYGDAAQNAGATVIDTGRLDEIIAFSPTRGTITVGAGLTIENLLRATVPSGWFVAVTPGTRHVSIGGAIAADVHGKNHHHDGSFCSHVVSMTVDSGAGPRVLTPDATPSEFWATAGGMGLTGIIVEATLQLRSIETSLISSTTERHGTLGSLMAALEAADRGNTYTVAWLDTLNPGPRLGRGLLMRGEHATIADFERHDRTKNRFGYAPRAVRLPPVSVPVLSPGIGRVFNRTWYQINRPVQRLESMSHFFHPLDAVANWNLLYGRKGFVQWQMVVPDDAAGFVGDALGRLQEIGAGSFLSVLKRFGSANPGPLSFPTPGWTLAVDISANTPHLDRTLHRLDVQVADLGGRIYLAKDARLHPELLASMYPRLDEWRATRDAMDPQRRFRSDLSRRLMLTGTNEANVTTAAVSTLTAHRSRHNEDERARRR